jgi:hypothetical protein
VFMKVVKYMDKIEVWYEIWEYKSI